MYRTWAGELWRLVGIALGCLVLGAVTGHVLASLLLGAVLYIAWHLFQLFRLDRWLRESKRFHPPDARGIWGDVFYHIERLRMRDRKRKRRLAGILSQFQEAIAAMPDGTVVLGARGEIQWFNDSAKRLLRLKPQDVGRHITNLVRHPAVTDYLRGGDFSDGVQFPSPVDERLMLKLRIVPYGADQRLVLVRDVTELYRVEQMRRDFVANASHELRSPLTVISGYLETLADSDAGQRPEWRPALIQMQHQTRRMRRLVDDLMLLSRLESAEPPRRGGVVAVPAMLAAIREDAVALSGDADHDIVVDADPALCLRGAEEELRSAFSNLVFNAVQYTPAGGRIEVRWYADDAGGHLEVRDTGVGIPSEHIPRLTERFYRVDVGRSREAGGTGLGLAIVKHVLQRHDARLRVESTVGEGSTFACDFPAKRLQRQPTADAG